MTGQRHRYDYTIRPGSAPEKVIRMVGAGRRVLELGPGPGSITKHLKDNGCHVTALELDPAAIDLVAEYCERVIPCNLNNADWPMFLAGLETFSVIVAADVFEHLYDPWTTLLRARSLLATDGCIVVSLPHMAHNAVIACLLNEDFAYQSWGLLDSTHIRFWGLKNMQKMFEDADLKIVEAEFVVYSPEQTELAHFWHKLPATSRTALSKHRFGNVYQVVIRAIPRASGGVALQLESIDVPKPEENPEGDLSTLRRRLRHIGGRLDPTTQVRLVRLLRRLRLWPQSRSGQ